MPADKPDLSRATPRPWRRDGKYIWRSGSGNANICAVGEPHEGDFVGYKELRIDSSDWNEAQANAALIVEAVNAYDNVRATAAAYDRLIAVNAALVEALQTTLRWAEVYAGAYKRGTGPWNDLEKARAALKLARETAND